jgi:5-methylcytosine-specific restriction endonuclease McrA
MKTKVYHDTEYTSNRRLMLEQFTPGHTVCGICHRVIASVAVMSIDHVIAVRRGGSHSRGNLQYAHRSCNSSKQSG